MRYFKVLHRGSSNDFYLVEEDGEYHILEIYDDLEQGDIIIETDSFEYYCNNENIFAMLQWEYVDLNRAKHILIYGE